MAGTKIRIGHCCFGNGDNNKDTKLNQRFICETDTGIATYCKVAVIINFAIGYNCKPVVRRTVYLQCNEGRPFICHGGGGKTVTSV